MRPLLLILLCLSVLPLASCGDDASPIERYEDVNRRIDAQTPEETGRAPTPMKAGAGERIVVTIESDGAGTWTAHAKAETTERVFSAAEAEARLGAWIETQMRTHGLSRGSVAVDEEAPMELFLVVTNAFVGAGIQDIAMEGVPSDDTTLLYIKIPEAVFPIERARKYEDPIDALLKKHKLGSVSGGGSMLNKDGEIEYVGIDCDVTDVEKALPLLMQKLRNIGAPKGTVIEQYEPERIDHEVK